MNFSKSTILLLLILLSMTFTACSNIEETEGIGQTNFSSEIYNLSVTYKGSVYKVPCINDSVGNVVYLDSEFKSIYDKELANDSNIATLYLGEDSIAYFQNLNTMLSSLNYGIDPEFPNLKHIGWGDKISSIQFRIGKKEDYKSNY